MINRHVDSFDSAVAWRVFWGIVLVVVLLAAVVFQAQAAPVEAKVKLSAYRVNDRVVVVGSGFESRQVHYVTARLGKTTSTRLGYLTPNAQGEFERRFILPNKYLKYKTFEVCVKNSRTSSVKCARVSS